MHIIADSGEQCILFIKTTHAPYACYLTKAFDIFMSSLSLQDIFIVSTAAIAATQ